MIWDDYGLTVFLGDSFFRISQTAILASLAAAAILLFLGFLYLQFFAPGKGGPCQWRRARDRCPPKECKKTLKSGI